MSAAATDLAASARVPDAGQAAAAGVALSQAVWSDACLAAALIAIDPAGLGGAVLRARAGPVRDAWLTLLRGFDPAAPFRRIPLGITDDRLLGGLDLAATLRAGRPVAERGILVESDGGLVLLAMAERIPAGTAARMTAVLDAGAVCLERDGLTSVTKTRFGVIALDEGIGEDEQVAPAIAERLAFYLDLDCVSVRELPSTQSGMAPGAAVASLDLPSPTEIAFARALLPAIRPDGSALEALCTAALALGIDSCRAPLLALRAARAAAALEGRTDIEDDDILLAARLVLAPRATRLPPDQASAPEQQADPGQQDQAEQDKPDQDTPDDAQDTPRDSTQALNDMVLEATQASIPPGLLALLQAAGKPVRSGVSAGKVGRAQKSTQRGRPVGIFAGKPGGGARPNIVETLRAAAPWQRLRRDEVARAGASLAAHPRVLVRIEDFRVTRFEQRSESTTIFAVDASGSSALHRLAEAKGAIELLLADCYVRRDRVALIAFRGKTAELLLPPTRSLVRAKRSLAGLPGGGGTPLAAALDAAVALADAASRRGQTPFLVLLTDGKANITRAGDGGRTLAGEEAMQAARQVRAAGLACLLIDTSPRPQPQSATLAAAMDARYLPMPMAGSAGLSQAVRHAIPR